MRTVRKIKYSTPITPGKILSNNRPEFRPYCIEDFSIYMPIKSASIAATHANDLYEEFCEIRDRYLIDENL